ncbi:hypothetical protein FACS1894187_20570 [Synergistales bacterium]|nr:hypothetical protein FACS1894187_20570 [Synergistales bacterium]
MEKVANAETKDRPLRVMFQDEARFGRISDLKRCWAKKGVRPEVVSAMVREYIYVFDRREPKGWMS